MNDYTYHLWTRTGGPWFNRDREDGAGFGQLVKQLLAAFKASRDRAVAIRELSRLTDRQLADIGIRREQIRDVVHGLLARHDSAPKHAHTAAPKFKAAPCTS